MNLSASKIWNESNSTGIAFTKKKFIYLAVINNVRLYRQKITPMTCNAQTTTTRIHHIRAQYSINM